MREELEQAVSRLTNGKSAGSDDIVAELVTNRQGGQEMIDCKLVVGVIERNLEN